MVEIKQIRSLEDVAVTEVDGVKLKDHLPIKFANWIDLAWNPEFSDLVLSVYRQALYSS